MLVAIICSMCSFVATRVGVIREPSSAKPDSGVRLQTVIIFVTKDTNPRFAALQTAYTIVTIGDNCVKSFLVAVGLQRGPRANELLPRVTAQ